jgi:hypothetical protein
VSGHATNLLIGADEFDRVRMLALIGVLARQMRRTGRAAEGLALRGAATPTAGVRIGLVPTQGARVLARAAAHAALAQLLVLARVQVLAVGARVAGGRELRARRQDGNARGDAAARQVLGGRAGQWRQWRTLCAVGAVALVVGVDLVEEEDVGAAVGRASIDGRGEERAARLGFRVEPLLLKAEEPAMARLEGSVSRMADAFRRFLVVECLLWKFPLGICVLVMLLLVVVVVLLRYA